MNESYMSRRHITQRSTRSAARKISSRNGPKEKQQRKSGGTKKVRHDTITLYRPVSQSATQHLDELIFNREQALVRLQLYPDLSVSFLESVNQYRSITLFLIETIRSRRLHQPVGYDDQHHLNYCVKMIHENLKPYLPPKFLKALGFSVEKNPLLVWPSLTCAQVILCACQPQEVYLDFLVSKLQRHNALPLPLSHWVIFSPERCAHAMVFLLQEEMKEQVQEILTMGSEVSGTGHLNLNVNSVEASTEIMEAGPPIPLWSGGGLSQSQSELNKIDQLCQSISSVASRLTQDLDHLDTFEEECRESSIITTEQVTPDSPWTTQAIDDEYDFSSPHVQPMMDNTWHFGELENQPSCPSARREKGEFIRLELEPGASVVDGERKNQPLCPCVRREKGEFINLELQVDNELETPDQPRKAQSPLQRRLQAAVGQVQLNKQREKAKCGDEERRKQQAWTEQDEGQDSLYQYANRWSQIEMESLLLPSIPHPQGKDEDTFSSDTEMNEFDSETEKRAEIKSQPVKNADNTLDAATEALIHSDVEVIPWSVDKHQEKETTGAFSMNMNGELDEPDQPRKAESPLQRRLQAAVRQVQLNKQKEKQRERFVQLEVEGTFGALDIQENSDGELKKEQGRKEGEQSKEEYSVHSQEKEEGYYSSDSEMDEEHVACEEFDSEMEEEAVDTACEMTVLECPREQQQHSQEKETKIIILALQNENREEHHEEEKSPKIKEEELEEEEEESVKMHRPLQLRLKAAVKKVQLNKRKEKRIKEQTLNETEEQQELKEVQKQAEEKEKAKANEQEHANVQQREEEEKLQQQLQQELQELQGLQEQAKQQAKRQAKAEAEKKEKGQQEKLQEQQDRQEQAERRAREQAKAKANEKEKVLQEKLQENVQQREEEEKLQEQQERQEQAERQAREQAKAEAEEKVQQEKLQEQAKQSEENKQQQVSEQAKAEAEEQAKEQTEEQAEQLQDLRDKAEQQSKARANEQSNVQKEEEEQQKQAEEQATHEEVPAQEQVKVQSPLQRRLQKAVHKVRQMKNQHQLEEAQKEGRVERHENNRRPEDENPPAEELVHHQITEFWWTSLSLELWHRESAAIRIQSVFRYWTRHRCIYRGQHRFEVSGAPQNFHLSVWQHAHLWRIHVVGIAHQLRVPRIIMPNNKPNACDHSSSLLSAKAEEELVLLDMLDRIEVRPLGSKTLLHLNPDTRQLSTKRYLRRTSSSPKLRTVAKTVMTMQRLTRASKSSATLLDFAQSEESEIVSRLRKQAIQKEVDTPPSQGLDKVAEEKSNTIEGLVESPARQRDTRRQEERVETKAETMTPFQLDEEKEDTKAETYHLSNVGGTTPLQEERGEREAFHLSNVERATPLHKEKEDTKAETYHLSNVEGTTPLEEERVEAETKAETITPFQVEQAEDRAISPAPGAPLNEEEDYHITLNLSENEETLYHYDISSSEEEEEEYVEEYDEVSMQIMNDPDYNYHTVDPYHVAEYTSEDHPYHEAEYTSEDPYSTEQPYDVEAEAPQYTAEENQAYYDAYYADYYEGVGGYSQGENYTTGPQAIDLDYPNADEGGDAGTTDYDLDDFDS